MATPLSTAAASGPLLASDGGFVPPLLSLGLEQMEADAAGLAQALASGGKGCFTVQLTGVIRLHVERRYGAAAAARAAARIDPLVWRLAAGQIYDETLEGRGRQFAPSYLEGLGPSKPFHEAAEHPWCGELARYTDIIRGELHSRENEQLWGPAAKAMCARMYAPEWRIVGVVLGGLWVAGSSFPRLRAVLDSITGMRPYEVLLARMPAHTSIGPHSDNMNFILTAHLGLQIPARGRCELRVGDFARPWRNGEVLVFDTSYIHSAVNDADHDRYVLVCRFWHPSVSEEERYAILIMLAVIDRVKNQGQAASLFQAKHETHGPFPGNGGGGGDAAAA